MKLRNLVLFAIVCSLALPVMAANPIAKAGKWESTIQMEMPNMPMKMPAHTMTVCVTKEQAENAENLIPKTGDKRGGCTYTDVKVEGSTVIVEDDLREVRHDRHRQHDLPRRHVRRLDADEDARPGHVRQDDRQVPRRLRRHRGEQQVVSTRSHQSKGGSSSRLFCERRSDAC